MENGADINLTDHRGWAAVHLAVYVVGRDCHDSAGFSMENGADISINPAACCDNYDRVKSLVWIYDYIKRIDYTSQTALHCAVNSIRENEHALAYLLRQGTDFSTGDQSGQTALHIAAYTAHYPSLHSLLSNGPSPSSVDIEGCNALHYAIKGLRCSEYIAY